MKFYSRCVIINFICTGHGWQLIVGTRFKWEERINREKEGETKEIKNERERRKSREEEGKEKRERARVWKKGWESKREENCLSCYRRYVSVNMCPASEHTDCIRGYTSSNSSSSSVSSSFGRDRGGGGDDDGDGDGDGNDDGNDDGAKEDDEVAGGGCLWTCTLRTTLCAYTGSLICAGTSG